MFMVRAQEYGLKLNLAKRVFRGRRLTLLGHVFEDGHMRPDPDRLEPMVRFPVPTDAKSLERFLGLAVHYSRYADHFANVTAPLFRAKTDDVMPFSAQAVDAFERVKGAVGSAFFATPR
jgi:hypothetical protein